MLFVGEALVGNEAVDQLVKFNQALADHSASDPNPHLIDGIVLTKFDTIDDKVDRFGFLPWQKVFLPGQWKKTVKTGKNWNIQNCTETPQFG